MQINIKCQTFSNLSSIYTKTSQVTETKNHHKVPSMNRFFPQDHKSLNTVLYSDIQNKIESLWCMQTELPNST